MVWSTSDSISMFRFLLRTSNKASEFYKKVFYQGLSVPDEWILSPDKLLPLRSSLISGEMQFVFVLQQPGTLVISNGYTVLFCARVCMHMHLCVHVCVCVFVCLCICTYCVCMWNAEVNLHVHLFMGVYALSVCACGLQGQLQALSSNMLLLSF